MKSLNRVFLMGHLGHEPELKISANGKPYCRLNLATHRSLPGETPESERKTATDWHSVFVWGQQAERCSNFLRKGALVFVDGALTYWQVAQESPEKKNYKNAIHAHEVKFLSTAKASLEPPVLVENLDNLPQAPDHNAVAH